MRELKLVGIDLAKNVFQVCALSRAGKVVSNRTVRRNRLVDAVRQLDPPLIAMESCTSANHWGRTFMGMGYAVKLIPAQHCKPFLRGGKTDARDALAICEAAQRPDLHPVPVKSLMQQDLQLTYRVRRRQVRQMTAQINQIRGVAREYGVVLPPTVRPLCRALVDVLEDGDNGLTTSARQLIAELYEEVQLARARKDELEQRLRTQAEADPAFHRLQTIPGVGPIGAAALLAAVGDASQFENGRQMAAWVGLVPKQHGSGGTTRLLGITKNGDRELRALLIHGARTNVRWAKGRDTPLARWLLPLIERRGTNRAVVALANKITRIAWSVITRDEVFDEGRAFGGP